MNQLNESDALAVFPPEAGRSRSPTVPREARRHRGLAAVGVVALLAATVAVGRPDSRPSPIPSTHLDVTGMHVMAVPVPEVAFVAPTREKTGDEAERVRPAPFLGALDIRSDPAGAEVFLDRQRMGVTPLVVPRINAGSHVVRLDHHGFERWSSAVHVVTGRTAVINARLAEERP